MTPSGTHYDLGAGLVLGALVLIPAGLLRLRSFRVRNAFLVSVLAFLTGVAAVFGRSG